MIQPIGYKKCLKEDSCKGYHIVCFEDFDKCSRLDSKDFIRVYLNESDGVTESSKRITIFTVNDNSFLKKIPALTRVARIDRTVACFSAKKTNHSIT